MQGSVISNKPRMHTKKKHIRTIHTQKACVTKKHECAYLNWSGYWILL